LYSTSNRLRLEVLRRPPESAVCGLYKSELIFNRGPWRTVEDVELATLAWVHWWNTTRLHSAIGHVPLAEFERQWHGGYQSEALRGPRSGAKEVGDRNTPAESSPEQLVLAAEAH
jgi:hypothetical protein